MQTGARLALLIRANFKASSQVAIITIMTYVRASVYQLNAVTESYRKKTQNFMDPDFGARMLKPDGRGKDPLCIFEDEKSAQVGSAVGLGRE